jgi:hypothetical protein
MGDKYQEFKRVLCITARLCLACVTTSPSPWHIGEIDNYVTVLRIKFVMSRGKHIKDKTLLEVSSMPLSWRICSWL